MSLVEIENQDGVAILRLNRPRANAFDSELIETLRQALRESSGARAIVLTSSGVIFSAGWDLPWLIAFDRAEMARFVGRYCDLVREIFLFDAPVIAALPGHAIAGGLIVAAAADERYGAAEKGEYGLSEVLLGVPVPRCLLEPFRHAIGPRQTERLAATGENLLAEQARDIGLLDAILPRADLIPAAIARARILSERSPNAHAAIKRQARAAAAARFDAVREEDPFLDFWFSDDARRRIGALVAKLTRTN